MKQIILLGMLLCCMPFSLAYEFSEVMYNPLGSDSNREWVEVYGPPLDGLQFIEGGNAHFLTFIQGNCLDECVSIIADDAWGFLEEYSLSAGVLVYDSSWGSLLNSGETLALSNGSHILTNYSYLPDGEGGESLQLMGDVYVSAKATPGIIFEEEEVPEFGTLSVLIVLGGIGIVIFRNRQD